MTTRADAITRAGAVFAAARTERDGLRTPEAVAAWANPAGTDEERARLAAFYVELRTSAQGGLPAA